MLATPGPLGAFLEKSAKYTKSWKKNYVTFDPDTRNMGYGVSSEAEPKALMTVDVITCASEHNPKLYRGSPDLFSFHVTGVLGDGKNDSWTFRCPDESAFYKWYDIVREAAAAQGMMQPINCGLLKLDVRTQLDFVRVPLEYLFRFGALDRAIMYYFGLVVVSRGENQGTQDEILVIGDRSLYLFTCNAEIARCVPLAKVQKVCLGTDFVAFICSEPQHDILLMTSHALKITEIFEKAALVVQDTQECVVIEVKTSVTAKIYGMLHLAPRDGYSLTITTPTPKTRLKQAMDLYEKQFGRPYAPNEEPEAPAVGKSNQSGDAQNAGPTIDVTDPMAALLMRLGLAQYAAALQQQHIDVDVLSCMDPEDLVTFGIPDPAHREKIIAAVKGDELTTPIVAPAPVPVTKRPMITLESDDDDLPLPIPKSNIQLDDDDDNLLPPPNAPVVLDDSDDDLPLPKPKPKPALELSDDDLPPPKPAVVPDMDGI